VSESPLINFAAHQVRAGSAGAYEDFEQMAGLLVRALLGQDARRVVGPYDWGIDVLVGDLRGPVSVWQVKYLMGEFPGNRLSQIRSSLRSALRAAADHGYTLERWVLCIPSSLDRSATHRLQQWMFDHVGGAGVVIDLWDETVLRELLLRPEAADIYRHYYAPHIARQSGQVAPEQPMISFAGHEVRAGPGGSRDDFEQMIGLVVQAASDQDMRLSAAPAGWGTNALAGEQAGGVTIWQAEYLPQGVRHPQLNQITSDFTTAVNAAAGHGYPLKRWVLCIPSSMNGPATQRWHQWKADQASRTGLAIDLWDETVLRELLLRPEAAGIYHRYYAPTLSPEGGSGSRGHAFISYVREDSAQVDALQQMLEAAGVPVWRDTSSLWPGENWRAKIRDAISRDALVFIACFSSHSAARQHSYQNEELLLAIDQLRQRQPDDPWLIPVRFDDCNVPDFELGAGRTLASIHRADLFGTNRELATRRLVQAVQRLLK
jgi:hypothetical protein